MIVDLPNATVKNQARVDGYVKIKDISENTWIELVDNNKIIFASENDTLIIPHKIKPKSVELKTGATLIISGEIPVRVKTGIKIIVKAFENDEGVEIEVNTKEDYENITLSDKVTQEEIDKEIDDRKKVKKLIDKIESLDNISLKDAGKVASIREEYDGLEENKQALIPNLWKLKEAEARIKDLEATKLEKDKKAAQAVEDQIIALGEITLESKDAVEATRKAYDALSEDQKKLVTNLKILEEAEARIKKLEAEKLEEERQSKIVEVTLGKINAAETLEALELIKIDESLSENNKKNLEEAKADKRAKLEKVKEEVDKLAAQEVVDQITALGEITLESKDAVEIARDAYDDLTEDQKKLVNNIDILTDAEDKLNNLREEALADLKKNIDEFEATVIRLLNQQGRFHLKKVSDNEINFDFITEGNIGSIFKPNYSKEPATIQTPMSNYSRGSGLATVLGQKSDSNGKAQKARIDAIKEYIDMETATIDGKKFEGLDSMFQIYNMKVGDFLGTKTGKVKVKSEIAEDMYLEYTINFSLPENK